MRVGSFPRVEEVLKRGAALRGLSRDVNCDQQQP